MKLITHKWNFKEHRYKRHNEREVSVRVTPKRIRITSGVFSGMRFDRAGRCVDARDGFASYAYTLDVAATPDEQP